MTPLERLQTALQSPSPAQSVRGLVTSLAQEGHDKAEIYALLERCLLDLRERPEHSETREEALLDVMDAVTGWCHPSAALFSGEDPA